MLQIDKPMKHKALILRAQSGEWMFQVHRDDVEIGGGGGFVDHFEAIEMAQEAFGHIEDLELVLLSRPEGGSKIEPV